MYTIDGDFNSILSFDIISHIWTQVGNMTRSYEEEVTMGLV